jgi:hypothetical protein
VCPGDEAASLHRVSVREMMVERLCRPQSPTVSEPYGVQIDGNAVCAWSVQRLPFEPRGWLKDFPR